MGQFVGGCGRDRISPPRGTRKGEAQFVGDNLLAKTELYAITFESSELSERIARAATDIERAD